MNTTKRYAALALAAGILSAGTGCQSDGRSTADTKSTAPMASSDTASSTMKPVTPPAASATVAASPAAAVPEKDMTHVLAKDEAYYAGSPAQGRPPEGTLKSGTKVVVLMPRGSYSQVMTADGKRVFTSTAGLKPIGK